MSFVAGMEQFTVRASAASQLGTGVKLLHILPHGLQITAPRLIGNSVVGLSV